MKTYATSLFTFVILLFVYSAEARKSSGKSAMPQTPVYGEKMLSYFQWADLPSKQRANYISGLRIISSDWEAQQLIYGISEIRIEQPYEISQWTLLQQIIQSPAAFAEDLTSCSNIEFSINENELCAKKGSEDLLCSRSNNSPAKWAILCQEEFKKYLRNQEMSMTENDPRKDTLKKFRRRLTLNENAQKTREAHGPSPMRMSTPEEAARGAYPTPTPASASTSQSNISTLSEGPTCNQAVPTCGGAMAIRSIDALRKAYREEVSAEFAEDDRPCVIAGFVSVLNQKLKCTPVREFKIGSHWKGNCSNQDTMCNPLTFGFNKDGTPLCVPLGQNVTAECVIKADALGNTAGVVANQILGKSDIPELSQLTTDDFADAWQKHRRNLGRLCTEGTARIKFFCSECMTMNTQIRKMNMGSACADECGTVLTEDNSSCRSSYSEKSKAADGTN